MSNRGATAAPKARGSTPSVPPASPPGQVHGLVGEAEGLVELTPGVIAYNFAYLGLVWAAALGSIALFWAVPAWYTFVLALLVVSSRQQALLNCEHECLHRKFVRSRGANDLIGTWLCAAPVGSPYRVSQARHLAHHRLLCMPGDPDYVLHSGEPPKNTPRGLVSYFVQGLLGGYALMVLFGPKDPTAAAEGGSVRDLVAPALAQALIFAGLTLAFAWWVYPALWLLPLLTITTLGHLVRSFAEHAITPAEAATNGNRLITIHSNLLERGLVAPYFMNYHAEHHLLPSVPAVRLRKLQRRLAGSEGLPPLLERSSYGAAVRHYIGALRR